MRKVLGILGILWEYHKTIFPPPLFLIFNLSDIPNLLHDIQWTNCNCYCYIWLSIPVFKGHSLSKKVTYFPIIIHYKCIYDKSMQCSQFLPLLVKELWFNSHEECHWFTLLTGMSFENKLNLCTSQPIRVGLKCMGM